MMMSVRQPDQSYSGIVLTSSNFSNPADDSALETVFQHICKSCQGVSENLFPLHVNNVCDCIAHVSSRKREKRQNGIIGYLATKRTPFWLEITNEGRRVQRPRI
jgi:hypothetical protein